MKLFDSKYTTERLRRLNLHRIHSKHKDLIIPGSHVSENVNPSKVFINFSMMGVNTFIGENVWGYIPAFLSVMLKAAVSVEMVTLVVPLETEY